MSRLVRIDVIGSFLTQQYSWAIPSAKALRILSHFAPLVEIGSGSGYWARLLLDRGVDILPVDRTGTRASSSWTEVLQGGPGILPRLSSKRNLFLCYPDETSQLGSACLRRFKGEYLIHVGELFITGTQSGGLQRPWGRSSSADFQVELMETFHLLLVTRLPSFPVARDHLTVWRRTSFVRGQNYAKDRDDVWAAIPGEERIDFNASASSLRHLLY